MRGFVRTTVASMLAGTLALTSACGRPSSSRSELATYRTIEDMCSHFARGIELMKERDPQSVSEISREEVTDSTLIEHLSEVCIADLAGAEIAGVENSQVLPSEFESRVLDLPNDRASTPFLERILHYLVNLSKGESQESIRDKLARHAEVLSTYLSKLSPGKGIGVEAFVSAAAVMGKMSLEAVLLRSETDRDVSEIGLFCAPSVGVATSVGFGADIYVLSTLGCEANKDYRGGFLKGGMTIDGALFRFPYGEVSGGVSIGIRTEEFVNRIKNELDRNAAIVGLSQEADEFATRAGAAVNADPSLAPAALAAAQALGGAGTALGGSSRGGVVGPTLASLADAFAKAVTDRLHGEQLARLPLRDAVQYFINLSSDLPGVAAILTALRDSLTGCDSVSFGLGKSKSFYSALGPIGFNVEIQDYVQLAAIRMSDLQVTSPAAGETYREVATMKTRGTGGILEGTRLNYIRQIVKIAKLFRRLAKPENFYRECLANPARRFADMFRAVPNQPRDNGF